MATETLEQRADEGQGKETPNISTITARCGYCNEELQIPKEIVEEIRKVRYKFANEKLRNPFLNKQYNGFYVSREGFLYCDKSCFEMFTQD